MSELYAFVKELTKPNRPTH